MKSNSILTALVCCLALTACTYAQEPADVAVATPMAAVTEKPEFRIPVLSDLLDGLWGLFFPQEDAVETPPDKGSITDYIPASEDPDYGWYINLGFLGMIAAIPCFFYVSPKLAGILGVAGASAFFGGKFMSAWGWLFDIVSGAVLVIAGGLLIYALVVHRKDIWHVICNVDVLDKYPAKKKALKPSDSAGAYDLQEDGERPRPLL